MWEEYSSLAFLEEHIKYKVPSASDNIAIIDRILLPVVNEVGRVLSEKLCDADSIELISIMALGFAPFRGGILHYVDKRGLPNIITTLQKLVTETKNRGFLPCDFLLKKQGLFFPDIVKPTKESDAKAFDFATRNKPSLISLITLSASIGIVATLAYYYIRNR